MATSTRFGIRIVGQGFGWVKRGSNMKTLTAKANEIAKGRTIVSMVEMGCRGDGFLRITEDSVEWEGVGEAPGWVGEAQDYLRIHRGEVVT